MTTYRNTGSVCTTRGSRQQRRTRGTSTEPMDRGKGLTPEQTELALDIAQLSLDIIGIFEPTPFSDGANALISVGRGDWLGAGISVISFVPYVGDLAKFGKLPKYVKSIQKAVRIAANDAKFADYLRPALVKLKSVLDDIPMDSIPDKAVAHVAAIKSEIDGFLKTARSLDGPINRALQSLDGHLHEGFKKALNLKPDKNPRLLKKHPGPVGREKLIEELQSKGFVKIKDGNVVTGGTGKYGGNVNENKSEIWVRRITDDKSASSQFEAIRIDSIKRNPNLSTPTNPNRPGDGRIRKISGDGSVSQGQRQAADKSARRTHNSGVDYNKEMTDHLNSGRARKGDFSHWHHEKFEATPENLAGYLRGGKATPEITKMDNVGQVVSQ